MQHFCKVILKIYNSIPSYVTRIDQAVVKKAVKSHSGSTASTVKQMQDIVAMIEVKNDLLLLRRITAETFEKLQFEARLLLKGKYIYRLDNQTVAARAKLNIRTFFRHLQAAIDAFAAQLTFDGYDQDWFFATYLQQQWIRRVATSKEDTMICDGTFSCAKSAKSAETKKKILRHT